MKLLTIRQTFETSFPPYYWERRETSKIFAYLEQERFFQWGAVWKIYPSGSQPARLYGNHKTHKLKSESDKLTFRPIVSSIGAYNYKPKFLTSMLDPVIPKDHCTKDSFSFCK